MSPTCLTTTFVIVATKYVGRLCRWLPDTDNHHGDARVVAGKVSPFERRMGESNFVSRLERLAATESVPAGLGRLSL